MADAMLDPRQVVRVSPSGNDSADGVAAPVKTIKRAIDLATANREILAIRIGAGTYAVATGEVYPYSVPSGVAILGEPGTILAGTNAEVGLVVSTGSIQSLELTNFKTAVQTTGNATLTDLTVKASQIGVLADSTARLTGVRLTFVGDSQCSTVGLRARGMAQVAIATLVSTDTIALDESDDAVVSIANGIVMSKASQCDPLIKAAGKSLVLSDTTMSGGLNGISLGTEGRVDVALTNTTIADVGLGKLGHYAVAGYPHSFQMTGGEIRNSGGGTRLYGGRQDFTNVGVKGIVSYYGIIVDTGLQPAKIRLRNCTVTGNEGGVWVYSAANADLGTSVDPGNNTIQNNRFSNLHGEQGTMIAAIGNVWTPTVQGANSEGKYAPQQIPGPVNDGPSLNFSLAAGASVQF